MNTEVIKYLEEIKEHQMQTVELARSTEVYKLADKALKAIAVNGCSLQLPTEERIYVSKSNDGSDGVYCAFTNHTKGLKDCEESGTLLKSITLYRD